MTDQKPHANEHPQGVLERPSTIKGIYYGLWVVCIGLVLSDFTYHKHGHYDFETWPGFHAGFGFLAYVGLVLSATQLRRVLKRREDYYE